MPKSKVLVLVGAVFVLLVAAAALYFFLIKDMDYVADAPEGCPKSTSIVVMSEEAGTQKITSENSNFIHWDKSQGLLVFTNYTLNPDSIYSNIIEGNVLAVIKFRNGDSSELGVQKECSGRNNNPKSVYSGVQYLYRWSRWWSF